MINQPRYEKKYARMSAKRCAYAVSTLGSFLILLAGCTTSETLIEENASFPDVVLISIDTLRADRLGCYGWAAAETPSMDALAAEGTVFEAAYSTVPITLPAHASLLSGLIPPRHGVRDNGSYRLADSVETVAEVLKAHGYQTGAFIGAEPLAADRGLTQGFDLYDDQMAFRNLGGAGGVQAQRPERDAQEVAAKAAQWIRFCSKEQPLFAFVHFYDPHAPYEKAATGKNNGSYDGEIAYVDRVIGQFLESSLAGRDASNRLIIITSDHGEGLGEHREQTHCVFCYDSTLRIPLIIHAPGQVPAQRLNDPVGIIDVAPTLLQLAGVEGLNDRDGISLVENIREGRESGSRDLYFESLYGELRFGWAPLRGIRRGVTKFIDAPQPELYDLSNDPGELNNLIKKDDKIVSEFQTRLAEIGEGARALDEADEASIRALSSLGYVSARPAKTENDRARPDPKDRIEVYERFQLAHQLVLSGSLDQGLRVMADLQPALSDSPYFFLEWGNLLARNQDWKRAGRCFQQCLELTPDHVQARLNLAVAQIKLKDHQSAATTLEKLLEQVPDHAKAHLYAGVCARELGDLAKTAEHWRKFVELAPDHPEAAKIRLALQNSQ